MIGNFKSQNMLYVMQQHQVVGQPQLEIQQLMSEQGMPLLETRVCRHSKSFGEGNPQIFEETLVWKKRRIGCQQWTILWEQYIARKTTRRRVESLPEVIRWTELERKN
jgi:hypothetical protein